MMRCIAPALFFTTVGLLLLMPLSAASDQPLPMRRIGLQKADDVLFITFSYRDAFTESIQKKLHSGLTTSVVVQLTVEKKRCEASSCILGSNHRDYL